MNGALLISQSSSRLWLDPRTKLGLLLIMNIVLVGGGYSGASAWIRPVLAAIPCLLLMLEKKYRVALPYFIFVGMAMLSEGILISRTQGVVNLLLVILSGSVSRFVPGLVMGYYVVSTTQIGELIAALERMHFSPKIIIPLSVMLRFFPTVLEEVQAIGDAMRMRGIRLGGKHPGTFLEYRIIPLLLCSVKMGEELSAAALTRGLGKPVRRTNICAIGLKGLDWFLLCCSGTMLLIYSFLK